MPKSAYTLFFISKRACQYEVQVPGFENKH